MRQWVWCLVEVLVEFNAALSNVQRKVEFLWLVRLGSKYANLNPALGGGHLTLHFPEGKGNQVRGHPNGRIKVVEAVFALGFWHVSDDCFPRMLIKLDGQVKRRLSFRFVNAREGLAGERRFKLRSD